MNSIGNLINKYEYFKYSSASTVVIKMNLDVLLDDGSSTTITKAEKYKLEDLAALGHIIQKDIYNDLLEQAEEEFNNMGNALAILDQYVTTQVHTQQQPYQSKISLDGSEFIKEFRGIHGITY